jgi:hypothetical protein
MQDVNIPDDLRELEHGKVIAVEYSHYDINGYHFWMTKFEASHPLAPTSSNGVVASATDASGHVIDYYGILQKIIEYMFGGAKELKVVVFYCHWFDPIPSTRVDNFGMVDVKHNLHLSGTNIVLAHQAL